MEEKTTQQSTTSAAPKVDGDLPCPAEELSDTDLNSAVGGARPPSAYLDRHPRQIGRKRRK
ncbi:hypothetical protein DSM106972_046230 [Dulcicalothrix desertica PCC 7102]|uniref:Uncharacterized protein n=1 Tax=Dulcicalothrix desertica PCC 7102 TaxID=232991 RepID=A0A433VE63_9CYAN|nr:hypothetical protein [Dulcicalothrix desertica]RUT04395.1 hypothetical protein DSM106972_046230 [Dulcicalothrix desertica PCC 7102]TWH51249.1 hypothetical protein CAL7102_05643 [Dulcicalothrix desertica PCC 7102]